MGNRTEALRKARERYRRVRETTQFRMQRRRARSLRRATEAAAAGDFTDADVLRLWQVQRGECLHCGARLGNTFEGADFHVDHLTPLSRGGSNWPRNLALACPACNLSKGAKTPAEFRLHLRRRAAVS